MTVQMVVAAVTEVVGPENSTLPPPFARVDPNSGTFSYISGYTLDTVFPTSLGRVLYGYVSSSCL